jgi:hypothetical protein
MSGRMQDRGRVELRERPEMMTQIAVEISCIFRFDFVLGLVMRP